MSFFTRLLGFDDAKPVDPRLILSHSHQGQDLKLDGTLSENAKRRLFITVQLMNTFPAARCLIFKSVYFLPFQQHKFYLEALGADFKRLEFTGTMYSTAEEIDKANILYDLANLEVISVCDKSLVKEVRKEWEELNKTFLKKVRVKIVGVRKPFLHNDLLKLRSSTEEKKAVQTV